MIVILLFFFLMFKKAIRLSVGRKLMWTLSEILDL